ncbi:hypothetical protein [Leucobacter chromiireducens]|uniref:hypothetical protein n=1 Tax=Leucobacter chromiireducens TaxID=283877 RepID=UPI0019292170|nr:hypothetical protein [Leucobacter chromiireducens]
MNSTATVHSLQQRISEMQPLRLDERALPTSAGLRSLLPGGALRAGASYTVRGSQQLALAFLAAASAAGAWCGVIGLPAFGAEAAAALGIALDRCIVIPEPGAEAIGLAGALSEALTVVLVHTPARPRAGDAERIAARMREHGSALVVSGDWPNPESALSVTASRWSGLGHGAGILATRELAVQSQDRRGIRQHRVRFADGAVADRAVADRAVVEQVHVPGAQLPAAGAPKLRAVPDLRAGASVGAGEEHHARG